MRTHREVIEGQERRIRELEAEVDRLKFDELYLGKAKLRISKLEMEVLNLRDALEFVRRHAKLCRHDDPTLCEESCRVQLVASEALKGGRDE